METNRSKFENVKIYEILLKKFNFTDNACIEWGNNCGEVTNCLLYDTDMMRTTLCYVVAACLALTTLADIGVWWYSSTIKLWDEAEEEDSDLEMKLKSDSN